jgi:hypothetical protein
MDHHHDHRLDLGLFALAQFHGGLHFRVSASHQFLQQENRSSSALDACCTAGTGEPAQKTTTISDRGQVSEAS